MATPAIRALNQYFPDAEITVVANRWTAPAIETNPRVNQVIEWPERGGIPSVFQIGYLLRRSRCDLGVSFDRSPATAMVLRIAGIPTRAGIDSSSRGIGLTHRVEPSSDMHETQLYLAAVGALGIESRDPVPEYAVPDEAITSAQEVLPSASGGKTVVVHPGGAVNPGVAMLEKRWPATSFGELVALLAREAGATVILVGTETDRSAVDTVRDFAQVPVVDLCGQLSLPELAAVCQQASLYVGNDSGTSHLASAVGTPVVAIFGPTNPRRYRPLGRRTRVCAPEPSWFLGDAVDLRTADRAEVPDIASVPVPQVLNACLDLLGES